MRRGRLVAVLALGAFWVPGAAPAMAADTQGQVQNDICELLPVALPIPDGMGVISDLNNLYADFRRQQFGCE